METQSATTDAGGTATPADTGTALSPAAETAPTELPTAGADPTPAEPSEITAGDPDPAAPADEGGDAAKETSWRDQFNTNGDEKLQSLLDRFASPEAMLQAYRELQTKLSKRDEVKLKSDDPEQMKLIRKKMGLPENPDEYTLKPARDDLSDGELAVHDKMRQVMFDNTIPPEQAQAISDAYYDMVEEDVQAMAAAAAETTKTQQQALKDEYGSDYQKNMNAAMIYLDQKIGQEARMALVNTPLADGTQLGNNPTFVKVLVEQALQSIGDEELVQAGFDSTAVSPESRYRELLALSRTDPKRYDAPDVQGEIKRMRALMDKRART